MPARGSSAAVLSPRRRRPPTGRSLRPVDTAARLASIPAETRVLFSVRRDSQNGTAARRREHAFHGASPSPQACCNPPLLPRVTPRATMKLGLGAGRRGAQMKPRRRRPDGGAGRGEEGGSDPLGRVDLSRDQGFDPARTGTGSSRLPPVPVRLRRGLGYICIQLIFHPPRVRSRADRHSRTGGSRLPESRRGCVYFPPPLGLF